jgi:hypothetical protein
MSLRKGSSLATAGQGSKSLDVPAFVKKFVESDPPHPPNLGPHVPLWLHDSSNQYNSDYMRRPERMNSNCSTGTDFYGSTTAGMSPYDHMGARQQIPVYGEIHQESYANPFGQTFSNTFDPEHLSWINNMLGTAPHQTM